MTTETPAVIILEHFLIEIKTSGGDLELPRIQFLGQQLVEAAKTPDGYRDVVWRAGEYLILYASEYPDWGSEGFFDDYGYTAIQNSFEAVFALDDFPANLGFITHNFLPGGQLPRLFADARIRHTLEQCALERCRLSPDKIASLPSFFHDALLKYAIHTSNLVPIHLRLQIVSLLLLLPDDQLRVSRKDLITALLNVLLEDDRDINLFYCWSAALEQFSELVFETHFINTLKLLLLRLIELDEKDKVANLIQMFDHRPFTSVIGSEFELLAAYGLAGWWLFQRHRQGQGLEIAWQFIIETANSYPRFSAALSAYLEAGKSGMASPEEIEKIQQNFQTTMQELKLQMRLRGYRGVPLATQIQSDNLKRILGPLYETLEGSSSMPTGAIKEIRALDAEALIEDNSFQRSSMHPIEANLLMDMQRDYKQTVTLMKQALDLRLQIDEGDQESQISLSENLVQADIRRLLTEYPDLTDLVRAFTGVSAAEKADQTW